jgi:hypothetical protein
MQVLESGDEPVKVAGSADGCCRLFAGVCRCGHLYTLHAGDFFGATRRDVSVAVDRLPSEVALRFPDRRGPKRRHNLFRVSAICCRIRLEMVRL